MKTRQGFTLIEVLVVITIVGILAAVTTMSYRHITKRAEQSARAADADGVYKLLDAYFIKHRTLPFGGGDTGMISGATTKWDDGTAARRSLTCDSLAGDVSIYSQYDATHSSRVLNFKGCYALPVGPLWNDYYSPIYEREYIAMHGVQLVNGARITGLVRGRDAKQDKRWQDVFVQIPELANFKASAKQVDVELILDGGVNHLRYCYHINELRKMCGSMFSVEDIKQLDVVY